MMLVLACVLLGTVSTRKLNIVQVLLQIALLYLHSYTSDINECEAVPAICSQKCQNTDGGFKCICNSEHYILSAEDKKTCVPKSKGCKELNVSNYNFICVAPKWIFFAHGQSIWNISEDGKDFQLQRAGLQKTAMIDLDKKVGPIVNVISSHMKKQKTVGKSSVLCGYWCKQN
jgi:hypothetical protein